MRISLKFETEEKSFEKIKIYSLKNRDREMINRTFDELHEKERFK